MCLSTNRFRPIYRARILGERPGFSKAKQTALALFFAAASASAADLPFCDHAYDAGRPGRDTVMILGQSNALGFGLAEPGACFGPERSLAQAWGAPLRVIKLAVGQTSMDQWTSDGGDLFALAIKRWREAGAPELAAIVWMQGETDSAQSRLAWSYLARMRPTLTELHRVTGAAILLIRTNTPRARFNGLVRRDQAQLAAEGLATLVDADDLPRYSDGVHIDGEGQLALGRRVYAALPGNVNFSPLHRRAGK